MNYCLFIIVSYLVIKKKTIKIVFFYEPTLVYFFIPHLNDRVAGIKYKNTIKGDIQYNVLLDLPIRYSKG